MVFKFDSVWTESVLLVIYLCEIIKHFIFKTLQNKIEAREKLVQKIYKMKKALKRNFIFTKCN